MDLWRAAIRLLKYRVTNRISGLSVMVAAGLCNKP